MNTPAMTIEPISASGVERSNARDRIIDNAERLCLLALYVWLAMRLFRGYQTDGKFPNLLLLPSEGVVLVLMLVRKRAVEISRHPGEWCLSLLGTCAPMMVEPVSAKALIPQTAGTTMLVMGLLVQLHAKISLGRSFGCVPANRGVKSSGPYQFVRHPMYAGYLIGHIGFFSLNTSLWNLIVYAICYGAQVPRLLAEERLMGDDPRYREYRARVRYRLIPGLF